MSLPAQITFHRDEAQAIEFFEQHKGNGWTRIDPLVDYYFDLIKEAGPNWKRCEATVSRLQEIKDAVDEIVEYMVEKYTDWGSD